MRELEEKLSRCVDDLIDRYPKLEACRDSIVEGYFMMESCFLRDKKLLIAGNGGSAADALHIAGELMKRFMKPRKVDEPMARRLEEIDSERGTHLAANLEKGLMAIPLIGQDALTTAYINDVDARGMYAQQLYAYGRPEDVFLAISTSGNSKNILYATVVARAIKMPVLALTGKDGGELARVADVAVIVPEEETFRIQEYHLPIYHCWCRMLEERFF